MENIGLKKFFLYLLVCSIALSALMGIWAIISGEFGELQGKILGTTTTVVGTSVLGLACGAYLESPRSKKSPTRFVPVAGIVFAVISAGILLWMIWLSSSLGDELFFRSLGVSMVFAVSFAQLSLLSLARLAARFQWAITTAYVSILSLASTISAVILFSQGEDSFFIIRFIGILAVIDSAVTVMIPVFHRLSRGEFVYDEAISTTKIDAQISELKAQISRLEKRREEINRAGEKFDAP